MGHLDLPTNGVSGEAQPGTGAWDNDGYGHGTHVAGTIAALDNTEGVIGVHAGTALTLHIVKIFNDQGNWTYGSDLIDALDSCVAAGAQDLGASGREYLKKQLIIAVITTAQADVGEELVD